MKYERFGLRMFAAAPHCMVNVLSAARLGLADMEGKRHPPTEAELKLSAVPKPKPKKAGDPLSLAALLHIPGYVVSIATTPARARQ